MNYKSRIYSLNYSLVRKSISFSRCDLSFVLILILSLCFHLEAFSKFQQIDMNKTVNIHIQNASVKSALMELGKVSKLRIVMHDDLFESNKGLVNLNGNNITISQAFNKILKETNLGYQVLGHYIAIVSKKNQGTIRGVVLDAVSGVKLNGVTIKLKGTNLASAVSDANGNFTINTSNRVETLIFSFLGYREQEVRVRVGEDVQVKLRSVSISLEEVKVQAVQKVNTEASLLEVRRTAKGIQDGISAELINKTASINTTQALQRVTGVSVTDDKYVAVRGLGERSVIGQLNGARLASSNPDRSSIPLDLVPASLLDNITVYKTITSDQPADAAAGIVELKTKSIPDSLTFDVSFQSGFNSTVGIGGKFNSFQNSDMGFWANKINDKNLKPEFLNLTNEYPSGLASIQKMISNSQYSDEAWKETDRINAIMHDFDPILTSSYRRAPVNQLISATLGNKFEVFGKHKIGLILGGNYYKRISDIYNGELNQYSVYQGVVTGNDHVFSPRNIPNFTTPNRLFMGKYQTYQENTGVETINYGMLGGLTYRFSPSHEISMQYLGSWGGENSSTNMHGEYAYSGLPGTVSSDIYSLKQTYRTLNVWNFQGEHRLFAGEYSPKLSYTLSSSGSNQNDPDYRFASLAVYKPSSPVIIDFKDDPFPLYPDNPTRFSMNKLYALTSGYVNNIGMYGRIQAEPNGRRWRNLDERTYNYKADLLTYFPFLGTKQEFKTGFNYLFRDRSFMENQLFLPGSNFTNGGNASLYRVNGDLNRLVSPEVVGVYPVNNEQGEGAARVGGFLYNSAKSPNNYKGFYETSSFYGMFNLNIEEKFKISAGTRFERTDIRSIVDTAGIFLDPALTTPTEDGIRVPLYFIEPNSLYTTKYVPYYAVNLNYELYNRMNLRAAFNTTLARPELREITNVFEFDVFQMGLVIGNPNLINQKTENLDFRWEWFPNSGEVYAFSLFGKRINNQLIRVLDLKTEGLASKYPEFPTIQYQNDKNVGKVWGMELEVVKNLGLINEKLNGLTVSVNLMLAQSEVKKSEERLRANSTLDRHSPVNSPLFEQPPYAINAWLNYSNKQWGTEITGAFNMVGERLVQINLTGEPDLYSRPVPMLDLILSQKFLKRFELKAYAKNVLNPAIKTVYSGFNTGGTWYGNEYLNRSYKRGVEVMIGLNYNLL